MLATTLITLALASSALAVPSEKRASCDISKATIAFPAGQTALAAPTSKPSYVGVAIGTQNYTCSSAGTYTNVGAVAELFDIGCLYNSPAFSSIADTAYAIWKFVPPVITPQSVIASLHGSDSAAILGQHYYVPNPITGTGASPKWDFTSQGATKGNAKAYVVAAKVTGLAAPTGKQDIDWVHLKSVTGSLAAEVYRVDTRGGQPPASCKFGTDKDVFVKYVSKYWLMGASL
ncbi:putative malate dehydrogenase [Lyophyllum atratum]|nr:putative malate dehydrogenase [Lyophyllum atratum]